MSVTSEAYDNLASAFNRALAQAELQQKDPDSFIRQFVYQLTIDRVEDWENATSADQVIGCDIIAAEAKGTKYLDFFMDKSRKGYGHYSVELTQLLKTFENDLEIIAFLMQLLNLIREKKAASAKNQVEWKDHLKGI